MAGDLGLAGTVTERSAEIQEVHLVVVHYSSSEHEHLNNCFKVIYSSVHFFFPNSKCMIEPTE